MNLQTRAKTVLIAGVLFNLSVGMLYTWSIIRGRMMEPVLDGGWAWTSQQAGLPFTFAVLFFSLGVLIGGRIQDKIGPRWVVTFGGFCTGLGMIISGLMGNSPTGVLIGFGIVTGLGIGFGYGCVTPPALKWFHSSKKGMVSGLIVGGFGFGAVYFGPITSWLIYNFGIQEAFIFMGIGVMVVSMSIAQFVRNPPEGYEPPKPEKEKKAASKSFPDSTWRQMMGTPRFYLMFIMFMMTASVGLMIIGNITRIATIQMDITYAGTLAFLISFMAIMNMLGRIIGGFMSDKIGRINMLFVIFGLQFANILGFLVYNNFPTLILGIIGIGFCFGALLSVFPALTAEQYGLKNYGANYGIMYLAWGLSGVVAPVAADIIYDALGSFNVAYIICAVMMVFMVGVNFMFRANVRRLQ